MKNIFTNFISLLQIFTICFFITLAPATQLPDWDGFTINPAEGSQKNIKTYRAKGVSFNLVWCPPGTFMMGSPATEENRERDETQHPVTFTKGFWTMETEVTQELYLAVMAKNPSHFTNSGVQVPVEQVSWNDALAFAQRMTKLTRKKFQLPTEAQWEYACRAGTTSPFNTGSKITTEQANYNDRGPFISFANRVSRGITTPVKSFAPNAWGLYDMHGNVWEWCADWYGEFSSDSETDPQGPSTGSFHVRRGGSWLILANYCRSACRNRNTPENFYNYLGFRLCQIID